MLLNKFSKKVNQSLKIYQKIFKKKFGLKFMEKQFQGYILYDTLANNFLMKLL